MDIVDFLIAISLGMLGINTVFISIIYSMLPYHLKQENGRFTRWSIYPSEIVENNRKSLILLFGSILCIYVYILLNQSHVLQNQDLRYTFLAGSSLFILFSIILFYKSFIIIWDDINRRTYSEQERIFSNKSIKEMQELYKKYRINPTNSLSVAASNVINTELSFFERNESKLENLYQICLGLSEIYTNKIPIQRIKDHLDIENNEFNDLLAKLEKNNYIQKEDNIIKLINQFH